MSVAKAVKLTTFASLLAIILINFIYYIAERENVGVQARPYDFNCLQAARGVLKFRGADSWWPMLTVRDWLINHRSFDAYQQFFFEKGIKFQYPLTSLLFTAWIPTGNPSIEILNGLNLCTWAAFVAAMGLLSWEASKNYSEIIDGISSSFVAATSMFGTILFLPAVRAVYLGQIQVLLDFLFVLANYFYISKRPRAAGLLIGASALIKPQMALFILWGAFRRRTSFVLSISIALFAGYLLSGFLFGWEWPFAYLSVLNFISHHGESFYANQSVNGILNRVLGNGPNLVWDSHHFAPYSAVIYAVTCLSTAMFVCLGIFAIRIPQSRLIEGISFVIAGVCFTCASPVAWEHHFGVLLPGFALCFVALLRGESARLSRPWLMASLAAIFIVAASPEGVLNLLAATPANILQSYLFLCALWLLALLVLCANDLSAMAKASGVSTDRSPGALGC